MNLGSSFIFSVFIAGLVTFLAPCTLPLVPAYLGFISGVSVHHTREARRKIFLCGLAFVFGFSVVFMVFGAFAGLVGTNIAVYRPLLGQIGGVVVMVFGLLMIGFARVPFLQREHHVKLP